ncbi:hypothetical protein JS531_07305 [Bifidobacterium sp. CP2]|nr:hypothetical protein [Bifidobacterium sp. CP2]
MREGAKFCPACGQAVAAASAAPQPAAAQSAQPFYDTTAIGQHGAAPMPAAPMPSVPMPQATPSARQFSPSAGAAPSQPMPAPGMNGTPSGAAPVGVQPITADPLVKEMVSPRNIQAILASAGFGLLAAIVISIFPAIAFMQSSDLKEYLWPTDFKEPNFLHWLILATTWGLSGGIVPRHGSVDSPISQSQLEGLHGFGSLGLTGVVLIAAAAFGAYMLARKGAIRFKWAGVISPFIAALLAATVLTIIAAIGAAPLREGRTVYLYLSGATFRTFAMTFLLTLIGSGLGYMLAQYAPDSTNVFTAAWRWQHRTRGFVRSFLEFVELQLILILIIGIVLTLFITFKSNQGQFALLFPLTIPTLGELLFVIATFGGVTESGSTDTLGLFSWDTPTDTLLSSVSASIKLWIPWVMFIAMLILFFYVALRASARNLYDPAFKGWGHSWKMPVAIMTFWLIGGVLFCTYTVDTTIDSISSSYGPALWYFLVMGVWAYLIEAVANSFGPSMIMSMQGVWKLFAGGTVQTTPQEVVDYVASCNGRWFKKYPSSGVPSASALAVAQAAKAQAAKARAAAQTPVAATQAPFAANGQQSAAIPPIPGAAPAPAAQPGYGQQRQYGTVPSVPAPATPSVPTPAAPQYGAQPGHGAPAVPAVPVPPQPQPQPQRQGQQGGPSLPLPPRR